MSVYQGSWSNENQRIDIQVTVDGKPLPKLELPGADGTFGWGTFCPWASQKLLAYSMLHYELGTVNALPMPVAYKHASALCHVFVDDRLSKLGKQWSMTSEDIIEWINQYTTFSKLK